MSFWVIYSKGLEDLKGPPESNGLLLLKGPDEEDEEL
jgi:hypothetical protein